jgi:hypothetical protein
MHKFHSECLNNWYQRRVNTAYDCPLRCTNVTWDGVNCPGRQNQGQMRIHPLAPNRNDILVFIRTMLNLNPDVLRPALFLTLIFALLYIAAVLFVEVPAIRNVIIEFIRAYLIRIGRL